MTITTVTPVNTAETTDTTDTPEETITEIKIFGNDSLAILFETANPLTINIRDEHKATQFQVESGETRSDHVVIEPVEISMELLLTSEMADEFGAMQHAFDNHLLVGIQTRVKTYLPMLMVGFSHAEAPDMPDAVRVAVRFTEWRAVEPEYGELPPKKVAKKTQSSTVNRGKVQVQANTQMKTAGPSVASSGGKGGTGGAPK